MFPWLVSSRIYGPGTDEARQNEAMWSSKFIWLRIRLIGGSIEGSNGTFYYLWLDTKYILVLQWTITTTWKFDLKRVENM